MGRMPLIAKVLKNIQLRLRNHLSLSESMQDLKGFLQPITAAHQSAQASFL